MYMLSYHGAKGNRTFNTHSTIEDCKQDASVHAMENSRLKGEYLITKVKEVGNTGLVCADLTQKAYKGVKKGKAVLWEV